MSDKYTLRLLVDDSQVRALEARLGKMMGLSGTTTGVSGSGGSSGGAGVSGMAKNIAKLGAISIGVMGVLAIAKKMQSLILDSSPMLQAMLKLFNTALLFIFRPIGDFIGFLLRPVMIFFLRNIAIPWYRLAGPIMRQWGSSIGNGLVAFLSDPFGALFDWFSNASWAEILGISAFFPPILAIKAAVELFKLDLGSVGAGISEKFKGAMNRVGGLLNQVFNNAFKSIRESLNGAKQFFNGLWGDISEKVNDAISGVGEFLNPIFDNTFAKVGESFEGVKTFFADIWQSITDSIKPAWDALTSVWESIADFFKPVLEAIQGAVNLFGFGNKTESNTSTTANTGGSNGGAGIGSVALNIYDTVISNSIDFDVFVDRVRGGFEDFIRGLPRT